MINNEFCVLHLSDLHIKNESIKGSNYFSTALENLINDIVVQTQDLSAIILVVSGDIIDKGDYSKSEDTVISFFRALSDKIKDKVIDIQIVPGNHDRPRTEMNKLLSMAHSLKGIELSSKNAEAEWNLHKDSYKSFLNLANKIYSLFGKDKKIDNTFGIESINISGMNVCFMRIDTAWCSYSENDMRNLRISEYQRQNLKNEYQDLKNKLKMEGTPFVLNMAISHHPLNWLKAEEEDCFNEYILENDYLDVDILMCGHVHKRAVVNYFNHEHSIMTLVTGIGWGNNKPNESKEEHRYSIYTINVKRNSCDIVMRKTQSNLKFDYDYSAFTRKDEKRHNKLCYPIKIKENHPFIRLSSPDLNKAKSIFVDNTILDKIVEISNGIARFRGSIAKLYETYKQNFLESFFNKYNNNTSDDIYNDMLAKINDYLYTDAILSEEQKGQWLFVDTIFNDFATFLREICISFVTEFEECFPEETALRAHFRWYNKSKETFSMLCQHDNLPPEVRSIAMQEVEWGGLIKPAFEKEVPLVFSVNKAYNRTKTNWDDFITIIPRFNNFIEDVRIKKGRSTLNESRPILTFGVSIKYNTEDTAASSVLYILDYLKINLHITQAVDEYIRLFNPDVKKFLEHLKNIKEKVEHIA